MNKLLRMLGFASAVAAINEPVIPSDNLIPKTGGDGSRGIRMSSKDYAKRKTRMKIQKQSRKINRK